MSDVHQKAMRRFVPFCQAVLRGQQPAASDVRLPPRDPNAMTAEAVAVLADTANKAATRWLIRELGWRARDIADPEDDEEVLRVPVWDPAAWGDLRLRFTAETIDVLILTWNIAIRATSPKLARAQRRHINRTPQAERAAARERLSAEQHASRKASDRAALGGLVGAGNGDLIVGHLVARPAIGALNQSTGPAQLTNPLSQLAWYDIASPDPVQLERLFAADMLPLLPWIAASWPSSWRKRARRWERDWRAAAAAFTAQAALWGAWVRLAQSAGRPDLLVPFAEGYVDQLRRAEHTRAALAGQVQGMRHVEQQALWDAWAGALAPLASIHQAWKAARSTHPIDRLATDTLLLSGTADLDLPHWAAQATTLTASLRGDLG